MMIEEHTTNLIKGATMTTTEERTALATSTIDFRRVARVYSGKPGCMCGCKGKYTTQSAHREWAGKDRGYPILDNEVNDKVVKMMVAKMNQFPGKLEWADNGQYAFLNLETRVYAAYFANYTYQEAK